MTNSSTVLLVVLATAALHAVWNAVAKSIGDRWVATFLFGSVIAVTGAVGAVITTATLGLPDPASWPFLVLSAVLQCVYMVLLTRAYSLGQMSRLYPIARGTSPVVVTAVAVLLLHERLPAPAWLGLALLVFALATLALSRGVPRAGSGLGLALLTGFAIAAYTLLDGVGVRMTAEPLPYISWMFAVHGPLLAGLSAWQMGSGRRERVRGNVRMGLFGGLMSVTSYGIAVWAQAYAPIALVAAIRETSVVWGVLIARFILGEHLWRREVVAIVLAAGGAVLLQLGG
ncbi:EamA family transporter [Occultella kanbiaonis]|uniref:EamA family transporter n=1 Tax=Occultella kanbiaonis TaxID=2675754 RepID=UPI0013D2CFD6|nr:EamA family transporter [Occultella kanbiaonis]